MRSPFPFRQVMAPLTLNAAEPLRRAPGVEGDHPPAALQHGQMAAPILPRIRELAVS